MVSIIGLTILLVTTHVGASSAPSDEPHHHLNEGDRAWSSSQRQVAKHHWSVAAESADPAIRAMAELRLIMVSGNLGMARHGSRSQTALNECLSAEKVSPWCTLATADAVLFQYEIGIPTTLEYAIEAATSVRDELPAPAEARLVWAGVEPMDEMSSPTDGLGEMMATHGGWPKGPGTWVLNVGPVAAPGMGAGALVRFFHPDWKWNGWLLQTTAMWTTERFGTLQASIAAPTRIRWGAETNLSQHRVDLYTGDNKVEEIFLRSVRMRPYVSHSLGPFWIDGGPLLRWDQDQHSNQTLSGHGMQMGLFTHHSGAQQRLTFIGSTETSLSQYRFVSGAADLRMHRTRLAIRMRLDASHGPNAPGWRSVAYGGGSILRSAPIARWRTPVMSAGIVEWRQPIVPMLSIAMFGETAWAGDVHWGAGTGVRVHLPPRPHNTMRIDLAYGWEMGWSLTAGWGEAF